MSNENNNTMAAVEAAMEVDRYRQILRKGAVTREDIDRISDANHVLDTIEPDERMRIDRDEVTIRILAAEVRRLREENAKLKADFERENCHREMEMNRAILLERENAELRSDLEHDREINEAEAAIDADEKKALKAEIKKLREANQWRPIDSAPIDGEFLVFRLGKFINPKKARRGMNQSLYDIEANTYFYGENHPTHWRPLPAAPESEVKS